MNSVILLQARMGSSRMPGKVLREVCGKTLLELQVERLRLVRGATRVVVATSVNAADDVIARWCGDFGVDCFRGSEDDVLDRFYWAAKEFDAQVVVRTTADCPLNDPAVLSEILGHLLDRMDSCDFVSNALHRTFPYGIGGAAFKFSCLEEAWREAVDPAEREHVTSFIYWRPERYRLACVTSGGDYSKYRWTVDTEADFELVRLILENIYPKNPLFSWKDVLPLIERHPEWSEINAHVRQKIAIRTTNGGGAS